jgi:uncharacterized membrane protein YesL
MKKEFYDRPLYTIPNYIMGFFLISLYLAIANIPIILFLLFTAISPDNFNLLFLFLCLIPLGPSLGSLYSSVGRIIREKDIYFHSHFWSFYKNNFVSYLKLWLIELILLAVLSIDFQYFYFNKYQMGIHIVFATLIIICLLIGLYSFPIYSRFEIKFKSLLILSVYYTLKKFHITILKAAVIALSYYLLTYISIIFIIFMPGIICLIFFYYDKKMLDELENKFLSK